MKTAVILSTVAVLAMAGSAMAAPGDAAAAATLKLRIVPVDVTSANPLNLSFRTGTTHSKVLGTDTGNARVRRFSIQYQIQEGVGFEGIIASLASLQMTVTGSSSGGSSPALTFTRAALTKSQATTSGASNSLTPVGATDTSGNPTTPASIGTQGLHSVFRGGLSPADSTGNGLPSNGIISPLGIASITPLTLTQRDQFPDSHPGAWFGVYDFNVAVADNTGPGDATVSLQLAPIVDGQTLNAWGGYEDADPIPRTSRRFVGGSASFLVSAIPAPGSMALIGLGGLVAARRRRA